MPDVGKRAPASARIDRPHVIAVLTVLASVPLPLMLPLLVDEVLLNVPGALVQSMDRLFPAAWRGPTLYIGAILLLTAALRFVAVLLSVCCGRAVCTAACMHSADTELAAFRTDKLF